MHTQNTALQVLVPMHTYTTMKDLIPSTLLCQERATKRNRASFHSPSRHIICPMCLKTCSLSYLDKQARCSRLCSGLAVTFEVTGRSDPAKHAECSRSCHMI